MRCNRVTTGLLALFLLNTLAGCGEDVFYSNGHPIKLCDPYAGNSNPSPFNDGDAIEQEFFSQLLTLRKNQGLGSVVFDPELSAVARAHSQHMMTHSFWSHQNPEGDFPGDRLSKAGVTTQWHAEILGNIQNGTYTELFDSILSGWITSPGHYDVITKEPLTHIGVGYWYDPAINKKWVTVLVAVK